LIRAAREVGKNVTSILIRKLEEGIADCGIRNFTIPGGRTGLAVWTGCEPLIRYISSGCHANTRNAAGYVFSRILRDMNTDTNDRAVVLLNTDVTWGRVQWIDLHRHGGPWNESIHRDDRDLSCNEGNRPTPVHADEHGF
jgi:hypothetical protein